MVLNSILTYLIITLSFLNDSEMKQVRDLYEKAYHSEEDAQFFADFLKNLDKENNNLIKGYQASSEFYLSKYAWNPFQKFKHFNKGKELMELAIISDPESTELRFLRLAVQENLPSFLFYSDNLQEDKVQILSAMKDMKDLDLKKRMYVYLIESSLLTENEIKELHASQHKSESISKTASLN